MAVLSLNSSNVGNSLHQILNCDEIIPGDIVSYEMCKILLLYHPLGQRLVESPIKMAQSQKRQISVPKGPEEICREAFEREWDRLHCDSVIYDVMRLSRAYGVASLALLEKDRKPNEAIDVKNLWKETIAFNVFDPLNTAGSLVINQDPNAMDFLKANEIAVNGVSYHRSRTVVQMHERPVYIAYTSSAFGYVGRSVFQRALYPLKSFLQSMITDDMVLLKAGVIVAKMKQPGSIIDSIMQKMAGIKRDLVKEAVVGNVLGVSPEDSIETLNFTNLEGPTKQARANVLENIAASDDMPAQMLNAETFAEGFGEGTEDAKKLARYIARFRTEMTDLYNFMDRVVMLRAWNPDFYKEVIQPQFKDEYGDVPYESAFYDWANSFTAIWPNLLEEPDSEKSKVDETRHKAIIETLAEMKGDLDPQNRARLFQWAADNLNQNKLLFGTPLELDYEALADYEPPAPQVQNEEEGEGSQPDIPRIGLVK